MNLQIQPWPPRFYTYAAWCVDVEDATGTVDLIHVQSDKSAYYLYLTHIL